MKYFVTIGERTLEVEIGRQGVTVEGEVVEAELERIPETSVYSLLLGGRSYRLVAGQSGRGEWNLHLDGLETRASVLDERGRKIQELSARTAGPRGPKSVVAPMPGLVVKVEVEPGDAVEAGQGVVIIEAMKMENELKAEGQGTVLTVHVEPGQAVEKGAVLVDFE